MNKLILNMPFVSLNEYIDAERSNKQYAAKIKKQQTDSVYYLTRSQKFKLEPKKYDVMFTWYKPDNRKDHDNICFAKKFILDGIVKSGVLPNDNPKFIGDFQDKFVLDKTRPYVSCQVEFVESIERHTKRFKCLICGRDKFTKKSPHNCVGGFRKRNIEWEELK